MDTVTVGLIITGVSAIVLPISLWLDRRERRFERNEREMFACQDDQTTSAGSRTAALIGIVPQPYKGRTDGN